MSTTTKSMRSYWPKRARAKRTCSWMALSTPIWLSTRATTATYPIHEGVEGRDSGAIWIVSTVCVILGCCPSCLERDQQTFSILRRHISSVLRQFPSLTIQLCNLVAHPVGDERSRFQANGSCTGSHATRCSCSSRE